VNFSVERSLQSSFQIFVQNSFKVILLSALFVIFFFLIQGLAAFFTIMISQDFSGAGFSVVPSISKKILVFFVLFRNVVFLLQAMILLFLTNAFLPALRGHKVEFKNFFPGFKKIFLFAIGVSFFLAIPTICSILAVFLPMNEGIQFTLSAIAIVGSVALFRYFFFYIELLSGCSLSNSFKSSAVVTKGNFFSILFLIVMLILINFLVMLSVNLFGIIIVSVFILFTLPISILILADVYSQLTHDSSGDDSQEKTLRIEDDVMENTEKELI
jgi:hypothetical protein